MSKIGGLRHAWLFVHETAKVIPPAPSARSALPKSDHSFFGDATKIVLQKLDNAFLMYSTEYVKIFRTHVFLGVSVFTY